MCPYQEKENNDQQLTNLLQFSAVVLLDTLVPILQFFLTQVADSFDLQSLVKTLKTFY